MRIFKRFTIFAIALLLIGAAALISCEKEQVSLQDETALSESPLEAFDKAVKCQTIKSKESGVKTLMFMKCQKNAPTLAGLTRDFLVQELARQNGVTCEGRVGCSKKKSCALTSKGNINIAQGTVLMCNGVNDPECEQGEKKWTCTLEVVVNITLSCKCIKKPK